MIIYIHVDKRSNIHPIQLIYNDRTKERVIFRFFYKILKNAGTVGIHEVKIEKLNKEFKTRSYFSILTYISLSDNTVFEINIEAN